MEIYLVIVAIVLFAFLLMAPAAVFLYTLLRMCVMMRDDCHG